MCLQYLYNFTCLLKDIIITYFKQKFHTMKKLGIALLFATFVGTLFSQTADLEDHSEGIVKLNSRFSYLMLDQNQDLRKLDILLDARKNELFKPGTIYIGASIIGLLDYQHSNTEDKFGYLMRHPTSNNQRAKDVSEAVIHSAQLSFSGAVNNWISLYGELLYNPEQSFGAGTITSLGRNGVQLRKGMIVLGDMAKAPIYFAFGKMDGNFGQTGSVSPFTNSTMWHAFGTLAYGAVLGFDKAGINASLMLIQGGAQFRAAHTIVDDTNIPSQLNNFGLDINYTLEPIDKMQLKIGGSYQRGSAYCQPWPVQHFMPCEENVPAYSIYGKLDYGRLQLMGSFASTTDEWPGTFNPNPPLNEFEAAKVSSLSLGGSYRIYQTGELDFTLSGEFSNFVAGADGSPWERQNQIIAGLSMEVKSSSRLFFEFFNTSGYAPLNFISGGNMDDPGITHSNRDASSIGLVLGGVITL